MRALPATSESGGLTGPVKDRGVMRRIIQANIDRLKELLTTELDPTRRAMESTLLDEEKAKLAQEPKNKKAAF